MGFKVNRTGGMVVGAHNIGGGSASGTIEITKNGTYDVSAYAEADVQTPVPTGKINITENGTDIDVSDYALADVDVPQGIMVDEDYNISEGVLTSADIELDGDVIAHIPDNVLTVGNQAFRYNELVTKIIMGNNVTQIQDGIVGPPVGAFYGCINLREIILSNNLTRIPINAFIDCQKLAIITIPSSVTSIGDYAFDNCGSLANIIIKYIKAKINQIYKGVDNSTSFIFPVDEKGELKAFVSCGERPKFEINPDDMMLYETKYNNGIVENFKLDSESGVLKTT